MKRLSQVLIEEYGEKVYKLSLSSGCTCPNRDGSLSYGGCTFCSEGGSGDFAASPAPISKQIEEAKGKIKNKTSAKKYIAYFQSYTNTYGDIKELNAIYKEAITRDDIAILSLGTRPDCIGPEVITMLKELNSIKPVWIELGLQTIHEKTAERINRCYSLATFQEAYRNLTEAGIKVIVHVIFGLPGETRNDMLDTIRYLSKLSPTLWGIKIQMLHILQGTVLEKEYNNNPFPILSMEEYASLVAESIKILPEETIIHRMTGDGPGWLLIEPDWSRNKRKVMNLINKLISDQED